MLLGLSFDDPCGCIPSTVISKSLQPSTVMSGCMHTWHVRKCNSMRFSRATETAGHRIHHVDYRSRFVLTLGCAAALMDVQQDAL